MRIVVVEDEEIAAARLIRLTNRILGDELVALVHATSLEDARAHFEAAESGREPIDLLLLDLNLHGEDGFQLLSRCTAETFQTVVVSAQHDQALRAFDVGVTDFVAKPYDEARLRIAIERAQLQGRSPEQRLGVLTVKNASEIVFVPVDSLLYIQGADDYSELHCADGATHLHRKTLNVLTRLLPAHFERVHRSYIVNSRSVAAYGSKPGSRYFVRLKNGETLPVSRTRFKELKEQAG